MADYVSTADLDGVISDEDFVSKSVLSATRSVPVSPTLLPWDRFSHWVHCICIVTFDLELGQVLEILYPGHVKLTEREKTNICYLSFPDSNSGCIGDTQFHFRIRQCPGRRTVIPVHAQYNFECPTALQIDPSYFYGYVYFRQVKDRSLRRGYFQKSVVLLTRLPFVSLFYKLAEIIAPEFFENAEPSVEAACHDIDQWPPPIPGSVLNIPIVGNVLQIRIPSLSDKPGSAQPSGSPVALPCTTAPIVLPTIHELEAFRYFWPILSHIHLLWELVITGEPIVVMAASPTVCSGMVQALISMLSPLKYCGDFRPFFTIHDSEFKEYTTKAQAPPPVILGVTNPFFAKTLQHWPHIIRLEDSTSNCLSPILQKQKVKKGTSLKTRESKPGVYTRYKPFLQKDKTIMKKLLKGVQLCRPVQVQNSILRRHLLELTQSFMIPLERYMASLMPLQRNISPHKSTPTLRPFNPDDFLKTIETSGPNLTSGIKGDWTGLYRRFFRATNFSGWYNARHKEATRKLEALHLEVLRDADLMLWIRDKQEVEVVDLILKIKQKLESANADNLPVEPSTVQRLRARLEDILSTLPEDLQSVLRAS